MGIFGSIRKIKEGGQAMTKEQEEIEKLTNGEKIDFNTLVRKFKKEGIENFVVTKKEYIATVLNMLKEKDKEIEKYKNMIIEHKKQLRQSGIYGYDYDLKID